MAKKGSELTVPIAEFLPIIELSFAFTTKRDIVPALRYIYFQDDTIRAFSGEAGSIWYSPWATPVPFAIRGDLLAKIVQSLHGQGIETLELVRHEATLGIRAAGFRAQLPLLAETDRSAFVLQEPPKTRHDVSPDFWSALELAAMTVSKDETKPMLRGIQWSAQGGFLSSDAYRITAVHPDTKVRVSPPGNKAVLIPDHLLERLGARKREVTALALQEGMFWAFFDSGCVYGSLLEAEFPAGRPNEIIRAARKGKAAGGTTVTIPSGPMIQLALDRLLLFSEPPTYRIEAHITTDSLTLRSGEAAEETFPGTIRGNEGDFFVNGRFLAEAFSRVGPTFWTNPADPSVPLYFLADNKQVEHVVLRLVE